MTLDEKRFQTVWLDGHRVGVIFETMSLMDVPNQGHLYCNIMHTEHILHRDLDGQWNYYDKDDLSYMPICHDHLTGQSEQAKQDNAFEVLIDVFKEDEEARIEGIKENIELLQKTMDQIISLNQCPLCNGTGDVEISEREIRYGENAGMTEIDLDVCPECNGKKTYVGIDYIKERIKQLRNEI